MTTKVVELNPGFSLNESELRVVPFTYSEEYKAYEPDDRKMRIKTAACSEALAFASKITPVPGKRVLLVSAMGEYETWGENRKFDAFPRAALFGEDPKGVDLSSYSAYADKIPPRSVRGYTNYPTKFDSNGFQVGGANTYYEHENKYPVELLGKPVPGLPTHLGGDGGLFKHPKDSRCGFVLGSFFNPAMRRVEVVQEVWECRLPSLVHAIDNGFLPAISMACYVPCDRCSVCGNLAATDDQYCKCLHPKIGFRGRILASGITVVMFNDYIMLRDSSIVKIPAAVEGGTLMKVASGMYSRLLEPTHQGVEHQRHTPVAQARGSSEALAGLQILRAYEKPFNEKTASALRSIPLGELVPYLGVFGVYPTLQDLGTLMGLSLKSASDAEILLPHVLHEGVDLATDNVQQNLSNIAITDEVVFNIDNFQKVASVLKPYMTSKSYAPEYLYNRQPIEGLEKTASMVVDLDALKTLDDKTRTVILTKILLDKELNRKIHALLVQPLVQFELDRLGVYAINNNETSIPVYAKESDSYLKRQRFFK